MLSLSMIGDMVTKNVSWCMLYNTSQQGVDTSWQPVIQACVSGRGPRSRWPVPGNWLGGWSPPPGRSANRDQPPRARQCGDMPQLDDSDVVRLSNKLEFASMLFIYRWHLALRRATAAVLCSGPWRCGARDAPLIKPESRSWRKRAFFKFIKVVESSRCWAGVS